MGFYLDKLSETERERFVATMSQKTLMNLDKTIEYYGTSLIREHLLSGVPDSDEERGFWIGESYAAQKEFARILLNLSDAIAKVRKAMDMPTETPYYDWVGPL